MFHTAGPPGVGRTVLKRRLKETNPDHFQTPIPREYMHNGYTKITFDPIVQENIQVGRMQQRIDCRSLQICMKNK